MPKKRKKRQCIHAPPSEMWVAWLDCDEVRCVAFDVSQEGAVETVRKALKAKGMSPSKPDEWHIRARHYAGGEEAENTLAEEAKF